MGNSDSIFTGRTLRLRYLFEKQSRAGAAFCIVRERGAASGGINGDGFKKLAQLRGRASPEAARCAMRQPGDLLECGTRFPILALLKQKHRHAGEAELACEVA